MKTKNYRFIFKTFLLVFCIGFLPLKGEASVRVNFAIPYTDQYASNSVIIPFNSLDGLIILKAKVNGVEGNFILDTGANGLVLNNQYFKPDRLIPNKKGVGLGGETKELGVLRLDTFYMDELVFENVRAETIDLRQLEAQKKNRILGLIGYDILKDFEIMLNYRRSFLTFSRVDPNGQVLTPLPHTLEKVDSVSFVMGNHLPIIEVEVNKKKKLMGIDSGAEYNLLNIKRSKDIVEHFKIIKTIEITSASNSKNALAGRLYRLALIDRYKCGGMLTVLTNFKYLERIYGTKLDGILGYEFLARWLVSINYRKKILYLHKLEYTRP